MEVRRAQQAAVEALRRRVAVAITAQVVTLRGPEDWMGRAASMPVQEVKGLAYLPPRITQRKDPSRRWWRMGKVRRQVT